MTVYPMVKYNTLADYLKQISLRASLIAAVAA